MSRGGLTLGSYLAGYFAATSFGVAVFILPGGRFRLGSAEPRLLRNEVYLRAGFARARYARPNIPSQHLASFGSFL
jgi:hypothetical protein